MNRLDCFNVAAARILQNLLEKFPQPVLLEGEKLHAEFARDHVECDVRTTAHGNLLTWSVQFLIREGYVTTTSEVHGPNWANCVLTAKGVASLNRKLEALERSESVGGKLLGVGKLIVPDLAGAVMARILSAV